MKKKNSTSKADIRSGRTSEGWFPSREQISERAHQLWVEEGRPENRDLHHWLRAEQELRAEHDGGRAGSDSSGSSRRSDAGETREEIEADKRVDGLIERERDERSPKQERL